MTREEQIFNIAAQFAIDETDGQNTGKAASMRGLIFSAFKAGAQWADQHPHWIPVEERLPEEVSEIHHCSTDVLIGYFADGDNYQTTARYNCKEKVWCDADDWGEIDFPTHWMPLPAAPRKEE